MQKTRSEAQYRISTAISFYSELAQSPENLAGSYIEDLDMFDEELVMMATKDLNSLLKRRNVAKKRQKDIKQRRRTLKNR